MNRPREVLNVFATSLLTRGSDLSVEDPLTVFMMDVIGGLEQRTRGNSVVGTEKPRDPTWHRRGDRRWVRRARGGALKLVPCGDGTKGRLPEGTRVSPDLSRRREFACRRARATWSSSAARSPLKSALTSLLFISLDIQRRAVRSQGKLFTA